MVQKVDCGKAHHWDIDNDTQVGTCKKCGKVKKFPTFEQLYDKQSFSSRSGAGVHPITHPSFSARSIVDRIINR